MEQKFVEAINARKLAYAPYSNFLVGACLVMADGKLIQGCNVENASYGLCNCAERTALFSAYAMGYRKEDILELVVCTDTIIPSSPCGACRQVMAELMMPDAIVSLINPALQNTLTLTVNELLPFSFSGDKLNEQQ